MTSTQSLIVLLWLEFSQGFHEVINIMIKIMIHNDSL